MIQKTLKIILLALLLTVGTAVAWAQSENIAAAKLQREFPLLTARYGNLLEGQKAHYIFAVDVSSSMLPYEQTVMDNLQKFVAALPDGDQITIIRMADESYTGFVGLFKCITLDSGVRAALTGVIRSGDFKFLHDGDSRNGSDGFRTASLIVDAINTIGSNELTFIYLLTDFEYWTHAHHYDKSRADWASLGKRIPDSYRSGMCKFGVELRGDSRLRQEAIFKQEMDAIFGPINYQPVTSAAILSQWFGHIIADVMAMKLHASVKKDWRHVADSIRLGSTIRGSRVMVTPTVAGDQRQPLLFDSLTIELRPTAPVLRPMAPVTAAFGTEGCVGEVVVDKGFMPGYAAISDDSARLAVRLHSPYEEEISRLQVVCKEKPGTDGVGLWERSYPLSARGDKVWASALPLWLWLLVGLLLLVVAASLVVQLCVLKTSHPWMVRVKNNGNSVRSPKPEFTAPFTIGRGGDYPVEGATWIITIKGKKYNPLLLWKKSGYYITISSDAATVRDEYNTAVAGVTPGTDAFFCPLKGGKRFIIDHKPYRIDLQN